MRIYVTGGTKGLGAAIIQSFERQYMFDDIKNLSRSTGYDIRNGVEHFCKTDFDVYVNNAQYGFRQTELLYELFKRNKMRKCHIINIGSVSGDGDRKEYNPYAVEKAALEKATTQLQLVDSKCKVSLIKPGRMDTDMVKHIDAPKMYPQAVANAINFIISQSSDVLIKSLTIDVKE